MVTLIHCRYDKVIFILPLLNMMHAPTNIYLNVKSHGFQNKMDVVFIITNGHGKLTFIFLHLWESLFSYTH